MKVTSGDPRRRAIEAVKRFDTRHELAKKRYRSVVGDGAGHAEVPGRVLFYWVRLLGRQELLAQARCDIFVPAYGQHVIVEESTHAGQRYYIIVGRPDDLGWFPGPGGGSLAGPHHESHEVGGADMVTVGKYMLESLRALPTDPVSMSVFVSYDESLMFGRTVVRFPSSWLEELGEESDEFVPPESGFMWALLSVNEDAELTITYGEPAMVAPVKPACPTSEIPICWIYLSPGQTTITAAVIFDARPIFATGIVGDTGPTGPSGPTGPGSEDVGHIHICSEDKSAECDDYKMEFITAQEFEPTTMMVFRDGHLLRPFEESFEMVSCDYITILDSPAVGTDLLLFYLAAHD